MLQSRRNPRLYLRGSVFVLGMASAGIFFLTQSQAEEINLPWNTSTAYHEEVKDSHPWEEANTRTSEIETWALDSEKNENTVENQESWIPSGTPMWETDTLDAWTAWEATSSKEVENTTAIEMASESSQSEPLRSPGEKPDCAYLTASFVGDISNLYVWDSVTLQYKIKEGFKVTAIYWGKGEYGNTQIPEQEGQVTSSPFTKPWEKEVTVHIANQITGQDAALICPVSPKLNIKPKCGDGNKQGSEQCDDGNTNNDDGCSSSCQWEEPNCNKLSGNFSPTSGKKGTSVNANFRLEGASEWIELVGYNWDYSPYSTSATSTTSHTYSNAGNYTAAVKLRNKKDTSGNTYERCKKTSISIEDDPTPSCSQLSYTFSKTNPRPWESISVNFSVTADWIKIKSLNWWDGSAEVNDPQNGATHSYNALGTYIPKFRLENKTNPSKAITCPQTNNPSSLPQEKKIIVNAFCGNNSIEPGEECDGEEGCSPSCKWIIPSCENIKLTISPQEGFAPLKVKAELHPNTNILLESFSRGTGEAFPIGEERSFETTYTQMGHFIPIVKAKNKGNPSTLGSCSLAAPIRVSSASCGDGKIEHVEQCDDGNTQNGDGCSNACQLEKIDCKAVEIKLSPSQGIAPLTTELHFKNTTWFTLTTLNRDNGNILTGTQEHPILSPQKQSFDKVKNYNITVEFETTVKYASGLQAQKSTCQLPLSVEQKKNSGRSGGGGWGGSSLRKDDCPNWDFSPSYYDKKCEAEKKEQKSEPQHPIVASGCTLSRKNLPRFVDKRLPYSTELLDAYERAYGLKITTVCPIQNADLEGKLLRRHMAKMISVFAMEVFKVKPDHSKKCDFPDISDQTEELKHFIKLSCQLGIMGYKADGVTKRAKFEPNKQVTRAQFITILSRLLRGNKNDNNDAVWYYKKHLWALKDERILDAFITNARAAELRGLALIMLHKGYKYLNNIPY